MEKYERIQIQVKGQVQGVGFRPHIYRLATELALTGSVKNNESGVHVEVQGDAITEFLQRLQVEKPPLAEVEYIQHKIIPVKSNETHLSSHAMGVAEVLALGQSLNYLPSNLIIHGITIDPNAHDLPVLLSACDQLATQIMQEVIEAAK